MRINNKIKTRKIIKVIKLVCQTVVQLDVNSRVQHPVALFLHPVALFVSCYAPCPFLPCGALHICRHTTHCRLEESVLHQHGPYIVFKYSALGTCHGQAHMAM